MKKVIDIQAIENSCPPFELIRNWVPRKIVTEINTQRNYNIINNIYYMCFVVGFEIFSYLLDTELFNMSQNVEHTDFEYVGALSGMDVYIERYGLLRGNEIEFFSETKDYLKPIIREKKLKRILHEVI